jgi:4a-hydroxytetrahydrobiopterin dehydratase
MSGALSIAEIEQRLAELPGWQRAGSGDASAIAKTFATGNFLSGLSFVTKVAVLAEKANHHPDVELTYPRVTLTLTTHDAGGITEKDFALATQIDALA